MEALRQKMADIITTYPSRWGIVIINQTTGSRLEFNAEAVFPAASLIKVPIMYEIMRQAAAGIISLEDSLVVTNGVRAGGAGILKELRPDISLTVRDLITLMIIISDNTATNMLIDFAGMDKVNKTMINMGLKSTVLRRRMMDFAAARAGNENQTCAADLALLFAAIESSQGLPQSYGALMLDILTRQQIEDKLPFYLPEGTVLAHKTGTLPGVEHDAGILFLSDNSYIICILCDGLAVNYQGLQSIACIGKVVYDHFQQFLTGC
jgi:beta-lactamase class A